jgi:hypothetical protein
MSNGGIYACFRGTLEAKQIVSLSVRQYLLRSCPKEAIADSPIIKDRGRKTSLIRTDSGGKMQETDASETQGVWGGSKYLAFILVTQHFPPNHILIE